VSIARGSGADRRLTAWPIADVTTFEGCGEGDAGRMEGSSGGIVGGLGS